jgi:hypothetical protein
MEKNTASRGLPVLFFSSSVKQVGLKLFNNFQAATTNTCSSGLPY